MAKQLVVLLWSLFIAIPAWGQETLLEQRRAQARSAPKDVAAQSALGLALLKAGRWQEAEQQLQTAARLQGNSIEAQYEVVKVKFESGNYQAARNACRELSEKRADSPLAHVCQARAFLVWNRSARAFEELDKALALDPNNTEALLAMGDAHRLRGAYNESQKAYERVLAIAPYNAQAYLGLGRLNAVSGKKTEAIEALRNALRYDSSSPEIQLERGKLIAGEEGLALVLQAVQGRPKWDEADLALAELYLATGKADIAEKTASDLLKRSPNFADAYTVLGRAQYEINNFPEAEKVLRRAIELVPNNRAAALTLAHVLAKTGRYDDAFEQYRVASDISPNDPEPLIAAGELGLTLQRNALATGFLTRALERNQNSAKTLALLGDAMAALSDREQARVYYKRALNAQGDIDQKRIEQRLKELK